MGEKHFTWREQAERELLCCEVHDETPRFRIPENWHVPNFCMLYYLENAKMTECMTCEHSRYKPRTGRGKTLVAYKKLRYFPITSRLLSTWHDTNHMMQLMEWWCILLTAKRGNTLIVCILTFQLNQGTCVLGCVQTNSTHLGHLLLLILVGRSY